MVAGIRARRARDSAETSGAVSGATSDDIAVKSHLHRIFILGYRHLKRVATSTGEDQRRCADRAPKRRGRVTCAADISQAREVVAALVIDKDLRLGFEAGFLSVCFSLRLSVLRRRGRSITPASRRWRWGS